MSCAGDAIYELAPRGASLRALDANTLQERWRVAVGKYQHKAPVVVGGEVLVWIDKQVHAFNVSDGSTAWVSDDTIADAPVGPQADGRWIVVRSRAGRTPTLYVLRR